MKALGALLVSALLALVPLSASSADNSTLQNMKGSVTYGPATGTVTQIVFTGTPKSVAPKSATTVDKSDGVATGPESLATITLPDSSQILMGSSSSVQMASFDQTDIAHAKFVVIGKMRFTVNHPSGAQADYHFSTATGEIAVRGTIGDILAQPGGGLQVNVYALTNPALPVQVTLVNGQVFTLAAGQSLVATAAAGAVTASVTAVSQSMFTPFTELGAPANAGALGISAGAGAAGAGAATGAAAATTTAVVAGAAAAAAAVTIVNSNKSSPSPAPTSTPSPTPQPSTTSLPITVNKATPHLPGVRPTPGAR